MRIFAALLLTRTTMRLGGIGLIESIEAPSDRRVRRLAEKSLFGETEGRIFPLVQGEGEAKGQETNGSSAPVVARQHRTGKVIVGTAKRLQHYAVGLVDFRSCPTNSSSPRPPCRMRCKSSSCDNARLVCEEYPTCWAVALDISLDVTLKGHHSGQWATLKEKIVAAPPPRNENGVVVQEGKIDGMTDFVCSNISKASAAAGACQIKCSRHNCGNAIELCTDMVRAACFLCQDHISYLISDIRYHAGVVLGCIAEHRCDVGYLETESSSKASVSQPPNTISPDQQQQQHKRGGRSTCVQPP